MSKCDSCRYSIANNDKYLASGECYFCNDYSEYQPADLTTIKRYTFPKLNDITHVVKDDGTDIWSITRKISAQVIDTEETMILNAIIDYARASGVDTLYVIDEEFVRSAIIHEFERRKNDGR